MIREPSGHGRRCPATDMHQTRVRCAEKAPVLTRMHANSALAGLASGGTRQIGAECRCGVHACPLSRVGERTQRSMAGPPFGSQGHLTTVQWRATSSAIVYQNIAFLHSLAPCSAQTAPTRPGKRGPLGLTQVVHSKARVPACPVYLRACGNFATASSPIFFPMAVPTSVEVR
jgi:hypothetical protein